jgi:integrase
MTRPLSDHDRQRVLLALREWAGRGTIVGLRTAAIVTLAADSGLRVKECVALNMCQVLTSAEPIRLVDRGYCRAAQAKGGSGGPFQLTRRAREAMHAYLIALRDSGWVTWPPEPGDPVFVGQTGRARAVGHGRLAIRTAQACWYEAQRRAGFWDRYGFHSLRADAATRLAAAGGNDRDVQAHLRLKDVRHAQSYVDAAVVRARAPRLAARASKVRTTVEAIEQ